METTIPQVSLPPHELHTQSGRNASLFCHTFGKCPSAWYTTKLGYLWAFYHNVQLKRSGVRNGNSRIQVQLREYGDAGSRQNSGLWHNAPVGVTTVWYGIVEFNVPLDTV